MHTQLLTPGALKDVIVVNKKKVMRKAQLGWTASEEGGEAVLSRNSSNQYP